MLLTDAAIRAAKPEQRKFKLYDRDGLFLLVNPGGSKLWRWRYHFDGKEKLMALGEYPFVNLEQARELNFAVRKTLAAGIDPMAERKAEAEAKQREAENSFEKIARKWWEWWAHNKSPRHADTVLRRLEADVFPAYGHKSIDAVGAPEIREAAASHSGALGRSASNSPGKLLFVLEDGPGRSITVQLCQPNRHICSLFWRACPTEVIKVCCDVAWRGAVYLDFCRRKTAGIVDRKSVQSGLRA